jgi:isoleucyl-tRNA synthetase
VLGKELGKNMKAAAEKIAALSRAEIEAILDGSTLSIEAGGQNVDLSAEKLDIQRIEKTGLKVLNSGNLTVALDTEITEALSLEGDVRDLVRGIQTLRKESNFDVSDRIKLFLHGSQRLKKAFDAFAGYVSSETLAVSVEWVEKPCQKEIEAGEEKWLVSIERCRDDEEK